VPLVALSLSFVPALPKALARPTGKDDEPVPEPSAPLRTALRRQRAKDLAVAAGLAAVLLYFGGSLGDRATASQAAPLSTSSAPPRTTAPTPQATQELVGSVPAPSYPPSSSERAVFDALNEARARGNFGLLQQDARLDAAAAAHAEYLAHNLGGAISHHQHADRPRFSGETPIARLAAAGYATEVSREAISNGTTARGCLELLNTIYHLGDLMSGATEVGIAVHPSAGCVIEPQLPLASPGPQARAAGTLGVYPFPGQTGVPAAFAPASETPNPAPDLGAALLGPPVLADLRSAAMPGLAASEVVLGRFELRELSAAAPVARRVRAGGSE